MESTLKGQKGGKEVKKLPGWMKYRDVKINPSQKNSRFYTVFKAVRRMVVPSLFDVFFVGLVNPVLPLVALDDADVVPKGFQWPFGYTMIVIILKRYFKLLGDFVAKKEEDFINEKEIKFAIVQKAQLKPSPVPSTTKITEVKFGVRKEAIDFFRENSRGEWSEDCEKVDHVIYGELLKAKDADRKDFIILQLHGGAMVMGSAQMYRHPCNNISQLAKCSVFSVNYRTAPGFPFPCGLIDCISGYMYLREKNPGVKIILQGDSAGGGLAISTMLALVEMKYSPLPDGAFLLSPWVDLTQSFPSILKNDHDYLPRPGEDVQPGRKNHYTPDSNLKNKYVSPLFADNLGRLPPLLVQTGGVERLFDENMAFCERVFRESGKHGGGGVTLEVYSGHVHVFQAFAAFNTGSYRALSRAANWMDKIVNRKSVSPYSSTSTVLSFDGEIIGSHPNSFIKASL